MPTLTATSPAPTCAGLPTSYREVRIGKIVYRVTSVYKGEVSLKNALEDLAVSRAMREAASE